MSRPFTKLKYFFQKTKMPKHLVEYYTMRYKKFNSDAPKELTNAVYTVDAIDLNSGTYTIRLIQEMSRRIDNQIMEHISEEIEQAA